MRTTISVIMPIYNAASFLEDSIGDILKQDYDNYELICVDDGSTDGSALLLDNFVKEHSQIRVIHQNNKGAGNARNTGLSDAKGDYVLFLDADDRFEPELLRRVVKKAEDIGCDIVVYGGDTFDNKTKRVGSAPWLISEPVPEIHGNPFDVINTTVWNKFFKRELIDKYGIRFLENHIAADTMYFTAVAVLCAKKITLINEKLVHYRINNDKSLITKQDKDPLGALESMIATKEKLDDLGVIYDVRYLESIARKNVLARLGIMNTADGFISLYEEAKSKWPLVFGEEIFERSCAEYLYHMRADLIDGRIINKENYLLSKELLRQVINQKVVIYGGSRVGFDYFCQMKRYDAIEVVGWVDRNFKGIGFPLESPESLKQKDFDLIVVAVLDKKLADAIIDDLKRMDIPEDKICWMKPDVV